MLTRPDTQPVTRQHHARTVAHMPWWWRTPATLLRLAAAFVLITHAMNIPR